jgi:hypothetical protein
MLRIVPTYGDQSLFAMDHYPDMLAGSSTDEFLLPAGAELARQVEARTDPLYRNAVPRDDGLFHCPWEGDDSCNHKADKLKCNYE